MWFELRGAMYTIYAMVVGERDVDNLLKLAGGPDRKMRLFYYMWCIKGADTTILVDTGMADEEMNRISDLQNPARPEVLLDRINVNPRNVKTTIVSHLHSDHFSAHSLYPEATFYIQAKEVAFWATLPRHHSSFRADCRVAELIGLNYAGRVRFVDGDEEIMPGIRVVLVGGHTPGGQIVTVQTARGTAVLTCDAIDFYEQMNDNIPSRIVSGRAEDESQGVLAFETIRRLATSPDLIIPGHDPLVMSKFPSVAEGVVRIGDE
ncbi:N-acyl homoserine lactonase family protein [Chloroflexota bacterium]